MLSRFVHEIQSAASGITMQKIILLTCMYAFLSGCASGHPDELTNDQIMSILEEHSIKNGSTGGDIERMLRTAHWEYFFSDGPGTEAYYIKSGPGGEKLLTIWMEDGVAEEIVIQIVRAPRLF